MSEPSAFHWHTTDYRERGRSRGRLNRGFWLRTPRLTPICRIFGHRPVVDGVDMRYGRDTAANPRRSRWACCDRCGVRFVQPIDSDLEIGQRYTGLIPPRDQWPFRGDGEGGTFGGQLVLLGGYDGVSAEVKIGNGGSEHVLAAHVHLSKLGALYLHTEHHGQWLQRRLNPRGYDSRVVGISVHHGRCHGQIWAKRNEYSRSDPWWMNWSFGIDPRTILFGPRRYSYEDVGGPVEVTVRMPHGDDHQVTLQLRRQSLGRDRLKRRELSWCVDWSARPGIPTETGNHGRVCGSAVNVSDYATDTGTWPVQAAANIAADLTRDRVREGYRQAVTS